MATRAQILARIEREAKKQGAVWVLLREGANHTIYTLNGVIVPIARHPRDFGPRYTETIYKECEQVLGKGWWR